MGNIRNAYIILVETAEGKRPLGRHSLDGKIILEWIDIWLSIRTSYDNSLGLCGLDSSGS